MRKDEFPIVDKLVKDSINEVLEKIRAEMQKEKENIHFDLNEQKAKWVNSGIYDGLTWAQEIIDKYMKGDTE